MEKLALRLQDIVATVHHFKEKQGDRVGSVLLERVSLPASMYAQHFISSRICHLRQKFVALIFVDGLQQPAWRAAHPVSATRIPAYSARRLCSEADLPVMT